jgi:hypothetical protein
MRRTTWICPSCTAPPRSRDGRWQHAGSRRTVAALVNAAAGVVAFDGERPYAVPALTVVGERVTIDVFNDRELAAKLDIRPITA